MDSFARVVEASNQLKKLKKALQGMKDNYVLVGIPAKEASREGEAITNAEILFIHTNGSPANRIPARPVIEPAIKENAEKLEKLLKEAGIAFMKENFDEGVEALKLLGMKAQNVVRAWFTNPANGWQPNSPSVQAAKMRKGANNPRPLIDTGELRKSITYVVVLGGERSDA